MKVIITYKDPDHSMEPSIQELTEKQQDLFYEISPGEYLTVEVDLETGSVQLLLDRNQS